VLAIVLVAPVAEELFFRGVVLNAWLREYGERRAVLGSAALFAAIHADIRSVDALIGSVVQVVPIFGLGIALALICLRTRSLVGPMAMHATFNAISLTLALLARLNGWDLPT
jgi:membrane protease YdiL (CAAX protease family)